VLSLSNNLYDARFLAGVCYFNATDFFEAHESWEDLWKDYQGPVRKFYQGLIQVAVCLHHFGNGNVHGARKLYHSSVAYLTPYRPHQDGVNLDQLLAELATCCQAILEPDEQFPAMEIEPAAIPKIHLDPAPADPSARP
jgi:hypothetical protein